MFSDLRALFFKFTEKYLNKFHGAWFAAHQNIWLVNLKFSVDPDEFNPSILIYIR